MNRKALKPWILSKLQGENKMADTKKCGGWVFQVSLDAMPEKIATAFGELNEHLIGARYRPIAYLGSQVVNGTNYAVLAEQIISDLADTKNIVLIVFNVAPGALKATLVYIKPVLDGFSQGCGGVKINDEFKVTDEAQKAFDDVTEQFVGSKVEIFAFLATQVTKGINYFYAAEVTPVYPNAEPSIDLVTINPMCASVKFEKIL